MAIQAHHLMRIMRAHMENTIPNTFLKMTKGDITELYACMYCKIRLGMLAKKNCTNSRVKVLLLGGKGGLVSVVWIGLTIDFLIFHVSNQSRVPCCFFLESHP